MRNNRRSGAGSLRPDLSSAEAAHETREIPHGGPSSAVLRGAAGSRARCPAVDGDRLLRRRRAPVRYAARVVGRRGPWVFVFVDGAGVVGMLEDGRTAIELAPWLGGNEKRAAAALADSEAVLAETEWQGRRLVETRLVRFSELVGPAPYDLDAVAAAARSAASW